MIAGVAFWYTVAAGAASPEFMVNSLHAGYQHYLVDPRKNNTVPGQFSEWFDGESLVNRGMCLSPSGSLRDCCGRRWRVCAG